MSFSISCIYMYLFIFITKQEGIFVDSKKKKEGKKAFLSNKN